MSDRIVAVPDYPRTFVCMCGHLKRKHWHTAKIPNGPCTECGCTAFTPEEICECDHGKKAHRKGYCNQSYIDGCKVFRPRRAAPQ